MDSALYDLAMDRTLTNIAWFLVVGLLVVGFLIGSFVLGQRIRKQERRPPTRDSQPHLPVGGAVYEVREERESRGFPEAGLRPHQMGGYGNGGSITHRHPEQARAARESGFEHPIQPGR
ncbi:MULTISPECIES: DUF6479 family protein [unclassified Streptomyces]|uniref:DUF6479 family protein n=1 Tax=unclassified Streptomyces TaxID=2593676 RepID=UPI0022719316|nr:MULTISPECIES: DUF6479 family protein [unclassified Streptomyces]MCY0922557.1 DUF6479 family protein [Streptomyces sp. H27-G5]MCY0963161.1 DUF6479 family protein [Streptomyces sp. H27-H5]